MTEITLNDVSMTVDGTHLLRGATLQFGTGALTAVLGPNGAGKTTLLRAALGSIKATSGTVHLNGVPIETVPPSEKARAVAYLPQTRSLTWPVRVREAVALGRYAFGAGLGREAERDAIAITRAMDACALTPLRDRRTDTLSGGELARVHLARAFATEAPLLIADEPIAALDPRHQLDVMALFRAYVDAGNGAVVILHDPSLAARYADRLVWMKDGAIIADGSPAETLTKARMAEVYGVEAEVEMKEGRPQATLLRSL